MTQVRYKVGVVGAGAVTKMHLDGLKRHPERVEVTAICDPNPEALQERADAYAIPQRYATLEHLIETSNIDVAVACTPSSIRTAVLLPLIEAGIPTLCEKPYTETLAEAVELAEAARRHGTPVCVNQNFRPFYTFNLVKNLLKEDVIGGVTSIIFQDLMFRQNSGWRKARERNALSVMGVHWLDGFRWILGAEARSLVCHTASSPAIEGAGETEAFVQLVFDNGTLVSYTQSFSTPRRFNEMLVIGERGTLLADYTSVDLYREKDKPAAQHWDNPTGGGDKKPDSAFYSLNELLRWLETGQEAPNSVHDNIKTIALLEAAYCSAAEGRIVTFKPGGML